MTDRSRWAARVPKGEQVPVHPQVQTLLDAMAQMGGPPLSELPPSEARAMYKAMAALEQGEEIQRVDERHVPTPDGDIPVRVYTPADAVGANRGVLIWFHGGGWVIGDLDTADATCRALANRAGAVVVSVEYRLAPEHPAPAALEDCLAALTWTVENGELLGVDVSKVAVGGDSAGGNLAALLCQRVRDEFGPDIDFQVLVYPVTDLTLSHPSMDENAEGYFLTKASMEWFVQCYVGDQDVKSAAVSPLHADSLAGLPPALVITAEYDPLRDEGTAYAAALQEAGVPTEHLRYDGQIHGFFAMSSMLDDAKQAVDAVGARLRAVLS
jgi:acetyl esterase